MQYQNSYSAFIGRDTNLYQGDDIDLLYVLRPHGWSDLLFYVGGDIHHFCITHVFSDPIVDLSYLASSLHHRVPAIELLLWDEPGGHILRCKQLNEQRHRYAVQLASFPEGPPESSQRTKTILVEFNIKAAHFVKLIYCQLEKTAKLYEEKTYRKHRDFSYAEFDCLRQQLFD